MGSLKLSIRSPIKAFLLEYTPDELSSLRKSLTYINTSVKHLIKRHYNNRYHNYYWKTNPDAWEAHLGELRKNLKKTLVFEEDGQFYIRPGSIPYLSGFDIEADNQIVYPTPKKMAWKNPPKFTLYPYQEESWTKLLQEKHGNVSLCTGAGKSLVIIKLCRELGLNSCIVVPSKSIFHELLEKFEFYLGKSNIGALGDGKRKLGKKITIAIADSLVNLKPGTEEYEFFSNKEAFFADESHTLPSETLEEVCHGVLANAAFRFYFSGTQTRNDGSVPLLQSIIGKTVCSLTTSEAILGGYICPHDFRIISVESSNPSFESSDALTIKREHFLKNSNNASFSAKLANGMASVGKGTLILVEELSQISMLIPMLKVPFAIAHSEKRKERLEELGIYKVDNAESVEKFNKGEVKVLIGTSCIATGTNIFPCHNVISWVGGSSPIKTKQGSVGRAVRWGHNNPWAAKCMPKTSSTIFDFDISDNETLERHLAARIECYRESGEGLIKYIRLKRD